MYRHINYGDSTANKSDYSNIPDAVGINGAVAVFTLRLQPDLMPLPVGKALDFLIQRGAVPWTLPLSLVGAVLGQAIEVVLNCGVGGGVGKGLDGGEKGVVDAVLVLLGGAKQEWEGVVVEWLNGECGRQHDRQEQLQSKNVHPTKTLQQSHITQSTITRQQPHINNHKLTMCLFISETNLSMRSERGWASLFLKSTAFVWCLFCCVST